MCDGYRIAPTGASGQASRCTGQGEDGQRGSPWQEGVAFGLFPSRGSFYRRAQAGTPLEISGIPWKMHGIPWKYPDSTWKNPEIPGRYLEKPGNTRSEKTIQPIPGLFQVALVKPTLQTLPPMLQKIFLMVFQVPGKSRKNPEKVGKAWKYLEKTWKSMEKHGNTWTVVGKGWKNLE